MNNYTVNSETIEKNALQLQSIFNLVKTSALNFEGEASGEVQEFLGNLTEICDNGKILAYSIWAKIQDENPSLTLAEQISNIINNPEVPTIISDALADGITDFENSLSCKIITPEYVQELLTR